MENKKTRNLSVSEYFLAIQKEYLIADFRRKIYFSVNDKEYYQKVMNYKAEKINNISERNRLDSILNSSKKMHEVECELFDRMGRPKFDMTENDLESYFSTGNDFSFQGEIWILDQINEDDTLTLYCTKMQEYKIANKQEVCRIL